MDISDTIQSLIWRSKPFLQTYVYPVLEFLQPIVAKLLSLIHTALIIPFWKRWKKLSWNRRFGIVIGLIVLVDITRVVSNKSQQHKLMATTIESAVHDAEGDEISISGATFEDEEYLSEDSAMERATGLAAMRGGVTGKFHGGGRRPGVISHAIHQIDLKSQQLDEQRKQQLLQEKEQAQQKKLALCADPSSTVECKCTDPTIPIAKMENVAWKKHHQTLLEDVQYAAAHEGRLDVVLLGDSLVEQWNGTHHWGSIRKPEQQELFQTFFSKHHKNSNNHNESDGKPVIKPLEGIALGSSSDTTTNLLWQLQNGILPKPTQLSQQANNTQAYAPLQLEAKVFVILVGTTDLVTKGCSVEATTQGIIAVAEYITSQRPGSFILIHGLLPRGEVRGQNLQDLGPTYDKILKVNQKLRDYCTLWERDRNWFYWDTGDLFLTSPTTTTTTTSGAETHSAAAGTATDDAMLLNTRLMADGIQPRMEGMERWGTQLLKAIKGLIYRQRNQADEPFKGCIQRPPQIQAIVQARHNNHQPPLILYYGYYHKTRTVQEWFLKNATQCYQCNSTTDRSLVSQADAVVFHYHSQYQNMPPHKYCGQSWVMISRENPNHLHYARLSTAEEKYEVMKKFDISVTYRLDDDIPIPYMAESGWNELQRMFLDPTPMVPTAQRNKEFPVTWIASNCDAQNNRTQYVAELMQYIGVKSYGKCLNNAPMTVARTNGNWSAGANDQVRGHKFYLAFENSDCPYYSTEKLYRAYQVGLIPVVLGCKEAPLFVPNRQHSAIFVRDFSNMQELAQLLHKINNDDALFESYLSYRGNLSEIDIEFQNRWFQPIYPRACHLCDLIRKDGPGYNPSQPTTGVTLDKLYCNNMAS